MFNAQDFIIFRDRPIVTVMLGLIVCFHLGLIVSHFPVFPWLLISSYTPVSVLLIISLLYTLNFLSFLVRYCLCQCLC